jgi:hypothetical protein
MAAQSDPDSVLRSNIFPRNAANTLILFSSQTQYRKRRVWLMD